MRKFAFPLLLLVAFAAAVTMSGSALAGGQCCVRNDQGVCVPCPTNANMTASTATKVACKPSVGLKTATCSVTSAVQTKPTGIFTTAVKATAVSTTAVKTRAVACGSIAECKGKICIPCDPGECELSCEKTTSHPEAAI